MVYGMEWKLNAHSTFLIFLHFLLAPSPSSMKLTATSLLLRSNASRFFTRKRAASAAAAENPEPTSPKVSCIGQVKLHSRKKVKQCRRRIGEVSFRSTEQPPPPTRWLHLPNISLVLHELCCLFRPRCCWEKKIKCSSGNNNDTLLGRLLVAKGGRRPDHEDGGAGNSRRHVFDDIEVKGDRVEVKGKAKGRSDSICIPPKNALLLMRCRSDPLKMVATANRISSDAAAYLHGDNILEEEKTTSSDEIVEDQKEMRLDDHREKLVVISTGEEKVEQEQENTEHDREVEAKSDDTIVQEEEENESDKLEAQLPECLLLMMREPKLSMEVSKETWVCATDFIRLPRLPADGRRGDHEPFIKRTDTRVPAQRGTRNDVEPARSSCSVSTAAVVERKLVNGGASEPLALTRCKSEPMSTAAAKLMPESSCWKNNVEPHRQAFGAAGVEC